MRSIFISVCAATTLFAVPVGAQASASRVATVRDVADKYIPAAYSGNGPVLCSLLTSAAQASGCKNIQILIVFSRRGRRG
jgi:hypothetical protein